MKYNPIKCWIVEDRVFDMQVVTQNQFDFQILKKSILKRGFRGFVINDALEEQNWYREFLLGMEVRVYIEGSGVYQIVNIDLSENEIYFERLNIPIGYMPWVFYSWQSDDNEVRLEIENVLEEVIEDINKTRNPRQPLELRNSMEVKGGSHNIVTELKKEIDRSLLVIADVTNIAQVIDLNGEVKEKWHPNSNVMFEMSYAFIKKTHDQVIVVKKTRPNQHENHSPFDTRQNRTVFYSELDELKENLMQAVSLSLEQIGYILKLN